MAIAVKNRFGGMDATVGRWDGHTLNLGVVGRMAAEHRSVVAADRGGCEMRADGPEAWRSSHLGH